ncbi:hypothetical protein LHP98_08520 [Rhodobacter sp. Har01]|uniref:hypothetical protein n=1 Tax=Rhodobacter sp. Har01 TaxID=2883999 RepID=UPI001D07C29F|nr:hypothetical protein [Rhodobacter sp. Har01]MCB6178173.1 hypothetical protein [Rhodobacter sp. Har01]
MTDTTTRPAGIGGIDLSGIDVAAAIFKATGGGYGAPGTNQPASEGTLSNSSDWLTNWGNGTLVDAFDFDQPPPADRDAPIKLLAEPEGSHPLIDLMKGDDQPAFTNGGPEGNACAPVVVGAIVIIAAVAVAAAYLGGAFDDKKPDVEKPKPEGEKDPETGLTIWQNDYRDPDTMTDTLQSPAEMMASLLGKAGVQGVDPTSVEITDLLGRLSDNMGKVTDLVGTVTGAAKSGDTGMFESATAELMKLAGLDGFEFDFGTPAPQDLMDGVFDAFGIAGGLDGAAYKEAMHDPDYLVTITEATTELSAWVSAWGDDFA